MLERRKIAYSQLKEKDFLLYGIGCIGNEVLNTLNYLNVLPIGIAVSELSETETQYEKDIEIRQIDNWLEFKNVNVLVATSERYFNEIENILKKNGFKNIFFVTSDLKNELAVNCYEKWFKKNDIDISREYIKLGNGKYINPFVNDIINPSCYLGQIGDYIIPMEYNDYTFVDEGTYECDNVKLSRGDVVFDLGSNVGSFAVYAASKGCICYAFEPTLDLIPFIHRHSELNENRIIPVDKAVADTCGITHFFTDPECCSGNTIYQGRINSKEEVLVEQITIDNFVEQNNIAKVDFIKADIEGAERHMLMGAYKTLRDFAPKLSLCTYHLIDDKEVLTDIILKANPNYKFIYKWKKLYAYV